ncbi:MAG: hypothetical protein ACYCUI_16615 [Vulcanimicrobiaceae bacterium]
MKIDKLKAKNSLLLVATCLVSIISASTIRQVYASTILQDKTLVAATSTALRKPTATDLAEIVPLVNAQFPQHPGAVGTFVQIASVTIASNYAVVNIWLLHPSGPVLGAGELLATNISGTWKTINYGMGGYAVADLLHAAPQMGVTVAKELVYGAAGSPVPYHCTANGVCTQSAPSGKPPR